MLTRQRLERGLQLTSASVQIYEEGTHLMLPWFERPVIYDARARPNVIQSTSGSRDLQMVRTTSCCNAMVSAQNRLPQHHG